MIVLNRVLASIRKRINAAENFVEYIDRLHELNIKYLGGGAVAEVFEHPRNPNIAVKIFRNMDLSYKAYLDWCLKHQRNKYVPKIIDVFPYDEYTIVFMEKLNPIVSDLRNYIVFLRKYFNIDKEFINPFTDTIVEDDYKLLPKLIVKERAEQNTDRHLTEWWSFISKYRTIDLHSGNVMKNSKGQLIFVDPLS